MPHLLFAPADHLGRLMDADDTSVPSNVARDETLAPVLARHCLVQQRTVGATRRPAGAAPSGLARRRPAVTAPRPRRRDRVGPSAGL